MERHVTPAIGLIKANRVSEAYLPFADCVDELIAEGADAIILGCTEIPVALQTGPPARVPIIDSIDVLARSAISW